MKDQRIPGVPLRGGRGLGPGGLGPVEFAAWYREESFRCWRALDAKALARIARELERCERQRRTVFVLGNGGSAAAASHVATDFSKTAARPGKPLLRCLALTDNNAFLTAIGNDLGYEEIFTRQLENLLGKGDFVLILSGSGNSPNVVSAARFARKRGAVTAGLTGFSGGKLRGLVDISLHVDSEQYGVIEDMHMSAAHALTFYLKQRR